jgi:hypothetical protein
MVGMGILVGSSPPGPVDKVQTGEVPVAMEFPPALQTGIVVINREEEAEEAVLHF